MPRSSIAAYPSCEACSRIFLHSHLGQPRVENAMGALFILARSHTTAGNANAAVTCRANVLRLMFDITSTASFARSLVRAMRPYVLVSVVSVVVKKHLPPRTQRTPRPAPT